MTTPVPAPAYALELRQRFTPLQNRYDLVGVDASGAENVLGYAEQKRFSLKEKVTFWSGPDRSQVVFTIQARNVFEIAGTYDVAGADGAVLATIQKDFKSSLTQSTYAVDVGGRQLVGKERGLIKALARRAVEVLTDWPWIFPIHFDFTSGDGLTMSIERQMRLRDVYRITIADGTLDWRVAGALAVTVDAFMNR
ncbi:MAG: hypothetical protein QOI82_3387 [Actinomycetota bacterium]|jgi:uncharacterized protein YxjI|nr:hypothetical protein [Actinomycetota bacterium]